MVKSLDIYLILAVLGLIVVGTINIYSQTQIQYQNYPVKKALFLKQIILILISFLIGFIFSLIDIEKIFDKFFLLLSLSIIIFLLIPIIFKKWVELNGSYRWITFKHFSIQPSEFSKLYLVLAFSYIFSHKKDSIFSFKRDLLFPLIIATIILGLIIAQKDLSTAFVIGTFLILAMFLGGVPMGIIIYLCIFTLCIFVILSFTADYRIKRLIAFFLPGKDLANISFQNYQSLRFLGLGGFAGKGIGWISSSGEYLPLSYSDFAFSSISCEMGLIGGFFIIICYLIIAIRGFSVSFDTSNKFDFFSTTFSTIMLIIQAAVNISVVTGILPPTGITLPFVSYGGSSLVVSMIFVSIIIKNRAKTEIRYNF